MSSPRTLAMINGGSSCIRFAVFSATAALERLLDGAVALTGPNGPRFTFTDRTGGTAVPSSLAVPEATPAGDFLVDWLDSNACFRRARVVGHRIVQGMQHSDPMRVTPSLLRELRGFQPLDPDHLPLQIDLVEAFSRRLPALPQVLCFDTAFHSGKPRVATQLPIPRRFESLGVRRYGFHGLSYSSMMEELARCGDPASATGRVILAHLGSGASMAAVRDGVSIDTTMGFTPASGLMMGTRSGDLDPGVFSFLARHEQMTPRQLDHMANQESGLLGVSQSSADVRELLAIEAMDTRAAEALALFCYQAKKCIGAYAAALGGLDTLAFAGGIGENAPRIRERICAGLGFLGVHIDPARNRRNAALISPEGAAVSVRVIRTDEERVMARACAAVLGLNGPGPDA